MILTGCASAPKPPDVILVQVEKPCECAPARPPTKRQKTAAELLRTYHQLEGAIAPAVTSPAATVTQIQAIKAMDNAARDQLRVLSAETPKPTPTTLAAVERALDNLRNTILQSDHQDTELHR